MDTAARDQTVQALRSAVHAGDLSALEDLLAEDVQWYGDGPAGACRSRDDVLAMLGQRRDDGFEHHPASVQVIGDHPLLQVEVTGEHGRSSVWLALVLDPAGRIILMRDYPGFETAEHDLTITAGSGSWTPAPGGQDEVPRLGVRDLVPFIAVADVERSVAFYRLLGMTVRETHRPDDRLEWALVKNEGAELMLTSAGEAVEPREPAVLFYLYAPDLAGLRDHLLRQGAWPGRIVDGSPGPRQEMRVTDPDGYCLMIAQTEEAA